MNAWDMIPSMPKAKAKVAWLIAMRIWNEKFSSKSQAMEALKF